MAVAGERALTGVQLAKRAGFYLVRGSVPGLVQVRGDVLEIGPESSEHEVACAAARRYVTRECDGLTDETVVESIVRAHGFVYVPRTGTSSACLAAVTTAAGHRARAQA